MIQLLYEPNFKPLNYIVKKFLQQLTYVFIRYFRHRSRDVLNILANNFPNIELFIFALEMKLCWIFLRYLKQRKSMLKQNY
jgi:hypothetical protein